MNLGLKCFFALGLSALAPAAAINQVDYSTLTGSQLIDFENVTGGTGAGTNHDEIVQPGHASFAERFVGQTLTASGDFDVLSGTPFPGLALQIGAANANLTVAGSGTDANGIIGNGPIGWPSFRAIGEGSIAILFDSDQSQLGFTFSGTNNGSATLDFFRRDGTLIQELVLTALTNANFGFSREGGVADIAGLSIMNNDASGVGIDNLKFDFSEVPEPTTSLLIGAGLMPLAVYSRRRRNC